VNLRNGLLLLTGLAVTFLAFPNSHLQFGLLGWVCLVPLFLVTNTASSLKDRWILSWVFFQTVFLILCYPGALPLREGSSTGIIIIWIFIFGFPLLCSTAWSFMGHIFSKTMTPVRILGTGVAWALFESLLASIPAGFPISLAITQQQFPSLLSICSWFGSTSLSALLIISNGAIAQSLQVKSPACLSLPLGCMALAALPGILTPTPKPETSINIAMVQPYIPWRTAYYAKNSSFLTNELLSHLTQLSSVAPGRPPSDILFWPELSTFTFDLRSRITQKYLNPVLNTHQVLVTGQNLHGNNVAVAIGKGPQILDAVTKSHPIPGFEPSQIQTANIRPLRTDQGELGTMLCYDVLFPKPSQELVHSKAKILVGLAFTTWLGKSHWPVLHAAYAPIRATESGRAFVFLNNHGPSTISDATGKRLSKIGFGKTASIQATIPVYSHLTPYSRFGRWMTSLYVLLLGLLSFWRPIKI
jgi:apolipoprotein N-acyltransferase